MTKKQFDEYYKSLPDDDKAHIQELIGSKLTDYPIVKHFKHELLNEYDLKKIPMGYTYKILNISINTETEDLFVNYEALYTDKSRSIKVGTVFSRPIESFIDRVDIEKYPYIRQKYRFECVNDVKYEFYKTKNGIVKSKKVIRKDFEVKINDELDCKFVQFATFLRKLVDSSTDQKIILYFNTFVERLCKIRNYVLKHKNNYIDEEE